MTLKSIEFADRQFWDMCEIMAIMNMLNFFGGVFPSEFLAGFALLHYGSVLKGQANTFSKHQYSNGRICLSLTHHI